MKLRFLQPLFATLVTGALAAVACAPESPPTTPRPPATTSPAIPGPGPSSPPEIVSPPGRIAFVTEVSPFNGALYIVNSDGSGLRQLAAGPAYYRRPRWSPDRRRIVFGRSADGSPSEILVIDVDGKGGTVRLAEGTDPAWSPDGTKIVFASNGGAPLGSAFGIYVMNADGSGIRQLTSPNNVDQCSQGASANDLNPDWSPDGKKILFERDFSIDDNGGFDCGLDGYGRIPNVYVMNADGTEAPRLRPVDLWDTDAEPGMVARWPVCRLFQAAWRSVRDQGRRIVRSATGRHQLPSV